MTRIDFSGYGLDEHDLKLFDVDYDIVVREGEVANLGVISCRIAVLNGGFLRVGTVCGGGHVVVFDGGLAMVGEVRDGTTAPKVISTVDVLGQANITTVCTFAHVHVREEGRGFINEVFDYAKVFVAGRVTVGKVFDEGGVSLWKSSGGHADIGEVSKRSHVDVMEGCTATMTKVVEEASAVVRGAAIIGELSRDSRVRVSGKTTIGKVADRNSVVCEGGTMVTLVGAA
ncbi:hypothetical protein [Spirillospora sp. CA-128828]|uniref:hypothetical protein n=1 Tax=Spirillospora sp. CA-128828 TaxID=3240033 RepID=UPI003D8AB6D5